MLAQSLTHFAWVAEQEGDGGRNAFELGRDYERSQHEAVKA